MDLDYGSRLKMQTGLRMLTKDAKQECRLNVDQGCRLDIGTTNSKMIKAIFVKDINFVLS